MTWIKSLFGATKHAPVSSTGTRPSTRARLTLETLAERAVPATGGGGGTAPLPDIELEVAGAKELAAKVSPLGAVSPTPPEMTGAVNVGTIDGSFAWLKQPIPVP
jgi:hypothetical protein